VKGKELVRRAISSDGPLPYLPKGELFIEDSFVHALLPEEDDRMGRLSKILDLLELDLLGILFSQLEDYGREGLERLQHLFLLAEFEGPFSFIGKTLGFIHALRSFKREPGVLLRLCGTFRAHLERKISFVKQWGFDGVALLDDLGGMDGPFFSVEDFRRILKPTYLEIARMAKEYGLYIFFHSDGRVQGLLSDFVEMGYDCLHTCDGSAGMDPYEMRVGLQRRVCLMGHLDLLSWDEQRISYEIEKAREEFSKGGLILGSSTGLSDRVLRRAILRLYPRLDERLRWHTSK
jgi:hypothetical protein